MRFVRLSQELIPIRNLVQDPNLDRSDHRSPRTGFSRGTHLMVTGTSFMHCNHLPSPGLCVAAGYSKMLAVLVLGPRERPLRLRQVPASVVEKLRAAWVR